MTDPNVPDSRRGRVLAGKYELAELIGSGGMSHVYRATTGGEDVAVKFLQRVHSSSEEIRERFRREAMALSRLRHPGVVSLLDYGDDGGELFIVMDLVRGRSFAEELADAGPAMPLDRIYRIFDQLLSILHVAHAQGIVHRDVKPSNVMILPGDRAMLLDFGLARIIVGIDEKLTATGHVHGTASYMSPEQCRGEEVDGATDVYAVGAMLFETIAGQAPFDGNSGAALMAAHIFADVPRISSRGAGRDVPPALEAAVRSALEKSAALRPSAEALRQHLRDVEQGTDTVSLGEVGALARTRGASLPRDQRGLTDGVSPLATTLTAAVGGRVLVDIRDGARAAAIQSALGVAGVSSVLAPDAEEVARQPPGYDVVIVSAREGTTARIAAIAAMPGHPRILVVDVADATMTSAVIRAGASDMTTDGAADADLARRVQRLLRRRR